MARDRVSDLRPTLPRASILAGLKPFVIVAVILLAALVYNARIRYEMIDFLTWRRAAERALDAQPLYRLEDGHYQFKYFPMFAVLMAPVGALDPETGKMLWFAVSVGCLAMMLRWSIRTLPGRRLSPSTLVLFAIVLMAKFYAHELVLGQTNLLLGTLLVAALVAVRAGKPLVGGALVGAAVFIKPYALVLIPWLLVSRGSRAAAMAVGVVTLGLFLPAAVYGWSGNLELLRGWWQTVTASTSPNLLGNDNVSIAAMWAKWLGPGSVATALTWLSLAVILILIIVVWRQRRRVSAPEYLECALLMLLVPLVSPQGWDYVLLLATPAVVCLVDRWRELTKPWRWGSAVALAVMGLTMFDVMGRTLYGQLMALSIITVCALGVAAALAHLRSHRLA